MGGGGFHLMRFRPPRSTGSGGGSSLHAGPRLTGLICLLNMETTSPPQSSPSCFETCQVDTKCGPRRCACVCTCTFSSSSSSSLFHRTGFSCTATPRLQRSPSVQIVTKQESLCCSFNSVSTRKLYSVSKWGGEIVFSSSN